MLKKKKDSLCAVDKTPNKEEHSDYEINCTHVSKMEYIDNFKHITKCHSPFKTNKQTNKQIFSCFCVTICISKQETKM
jgi:hypothetical protein